MEHPEDAIDSPNDPADWTVASYWRHPVDDLEPETAQPGAFRQTCISFLKVLFEIDSKMASAKDARLAWVQISIALNLLSTRDKTEAQIAHELGVNRQALSRGIKKILQMSSPSLRSLVAFNRGKFPAGLAATKPNGAPHQGFPESAGHLGPSTDQTKLPAA
jgi:hypothetical protein